ncbi:MAG: InlB B-repeat-containing protein [Clostridiales bacterium]|nr:InlB B-repeat-containing protein [Clostridiales bacterium]
MKKFLTVITVILSATLLALCAVACGGGDKDKPDGDKTPEYNISWYDEEGNLLTTQKLKEGATPSYTYNKQDTDEWDYTFEGWSETKGGRVLQTLPAVSGDASYYAIVRKVKQVYTVTFDSLGGSKVPSVDKEYGDTVDEPDAPTLSGKKLLGWCKTENGTDAVTFPITVTGHITLYAIWEDDPTPEYTVKWYDEEGNLLATQQLKEGATPSYTYNKQDTDEWDYTFEGWSETKGGTVLQTLPAVSGDASYYAVVSKVKQVYTVTFDSLGGSKVPSVDKEYGGTVDEPAKPTLNGKRFLSWCYNADGTNVVTFPITVRGNITLYAAWGDNIDVKALLNSLISGYKLDPYSYIPEAMLPSYTANFINADTIKKSEADYSSFVSKAQMPSRGFGEQWHMIADNLKQSQTFFNALSVVETISTATVTIFNNHVDSNPADYAHYAFKHGIYDVTIDCSGGKIYYVLDFSGTFPVFGEQKAQIALSMGILSGEREVRIQLGNPNVLAYTIKDDGYTFALKMLGVRRSMFDVSRDSSGKVTGHINEFLTASGVTDKAVASAADFYVDGAYVSAVGNKASGIPGFTGYISELYNKNTGKLISYEVRETLSAITYNTLWFDLADITGINSIKYDSNGKNFYVNGSSTEWKNKKVGGISTKTASRRFDIEFRSQYFYAQEDGEVVEVEVKVPMLFVQEEVYDTLASDVASVNSGVNISVGVSTAALNKQKADYATLVDVFIANKDTITPEYIIEFIGDPIEF